MSSPGDDSGPMRSADLFEDLLRQLKEFHQNTLHDLEAKVSKLKKDRCLDAQRLELFYNRNQQLKEQNKSLQETISLLEERLRSGECDRCSVLEEKLRSSQDQNLDVIFKLKNENNRLEDENQKLQAELEKMKTSHCCRCIRADSKEPSLPDQEDDVIPGSPILPSSLPVANKLRKRKQLDKSKHVRYAETPLEQNSSIFNELKKEPDGGAKNAGRGDVLVPNTCELDPSQSSNNEEEANMVVAETCCLELIGDRHLEMGLAPNHQSNRKSSWKQNIGLRPSSSSSTRIHGADLNTERSPSLLQSVERFSEEGCVQQAKRKKEERDPEVRRGGGGDVAVKVDNQGEGKQSEPESMSRSSTSVSNISFKMEQPENKATTATQSETPIRKLNASWSSPAFKKPLNKAKDEADGRRRRTTLHGGDVNRNNTVEPTWSVDPALALSVFESEQREEEEGEEEQRPGEMADTDCTFVSHSMLQRRGEDSPDREDMKSGLGEKANDSLDMMFDATTLGEYKSYNCSNLDQSLDCDDDDEEEEEAKEDIKNQDPESAAFPGKAGQPTFAHVAVVRKKDERRKLKGTTCKECEVYYAHLPEEEKQKKLSACSRHRYLYIPPNTPENFWEVGFPSTQTCIERGYIKEEKSPQGRSRRRQPFNALFSPKRSQKQS
ncbi:PREDICTED: DNA endonuclease RBBP8 isoform X1 [Cyprinodon variegatus]|uniref:DNA endonuclease RBBP8 isoform X1 n=1 Tax=Cyprinodon variegatus TaxID=28743 RepID=UPI0007425E0D|nr:PREDICTED: DNA endonuclease RBBP8 isoform X1 [Cyprinodon variegatus]XP_015250399.1 PREDICTED: DNA endonuclease RBBP8 isoform X1 [Cyprinodon variegatus]